MNLLKQKIKSNITKWRTDKLCSHRPHCLPPAFWYPNYESILKVWILILLLGNTNKWNKNNRNDSPTDVLDIAMDIVKYKISFLMAKRI